jgi:hypothetical protein
MCVMRSKRSDAQSLNRISDSNDIALAHEIKPVVYGIAYPRPVFDNLKVSPATDQQL